MFLELHKEDRIVRVLNKNTKLIEKLKGRGFKTLEEIEASKKVAKKTTKKAEVEETKQEKPAPKRRTRAKKTEK